MHKDQRRVKAAFLPRVMDRVFAETVLQNPFVRLGGLLLGATSLCVLVAVVFAHLIVPHTVFWIRVLLGIAILMAVLLRLGPLFDYLDERQHRHERFDKERERSQKLANELARRERLYAAHPVAQERRRAREWRLSRWESDVRLPSGEVPLSTRSTSIFYDELTNWRSDFSGLGVDVEPPSDTDG